MRKDPIVDTVVEVFLKSSPEYLPRVRRIAACLADSAGLACHEADDAALALSEACVGAIRRGSPSDADDLLSIRFKVSPRVMITELTDPLGADGVSSVPYSDMGLHLMALLADRVQFTRRGRGLKIRLIKRARRRRMTRIA